MNQKRQTVLIAAVIGALVLIGGVYFAAISPQLAKRSDANEKRGLAEQQTQMLDGQLVQLRSKRDALPQAQAEAETLVAKFPGEYKQADWLRAAYQTADRAGATISSVTPGDPEAAVPYSATPDPAAAAAPPADPAAPAPELLVSQSTIGLEVQGKPGALVDLLKGLEDMDRPMLVESVVFATSEGQGTMSVTGRIFLTRDLPVPPGA